MGVLVTFVVSGLKAVKVVTVNDFTCAGNLGVTVVTKGVTLVVTEG